MITTIALRRTFVVPALLALLPCAIASAAGAPLRGIAIDSRLEDAPLTIAGAHGVPIVRLAVDRATFNDTAAARLRDVLAQYQRRSVPVILSIEDVPAADADTEAWRQFVEAVAAIGRGRAIAYEIGDRQKALANDPSRFAYLLKMAAVQIRSADAVALIVEGPVRAEDTDWQTHVFSAGAAPYVDAVAVSPAGGTDSNPSSAPLSTMISLVRREKPSAPILLGPITLPDDADAASTRALNVILRTFGTQIQTTVFAGSPEALRAAAGAAARVADLLTGDLVPLDAGPAELRIEAGPAVAPASTYRLLYNSTAFATYLAYWGPPNVPVDIDVHVTNPTAVMVRDPFTGSTIAPAHLDRRADGHLQIRVAPLDHPFVIDFNYGEASEQVSSAEVSTAAALRVDEIIFRQQSVQAAQDARVHSYIAHMRMEQHFHPSPADPAYNLVTENRLFWDHQGVEWEELSFELNGAKWTKNRPAFPLVQPEKVLSLPLDLRLNEDYSYRLSGVETVGGSQAYVIVFEPRSAGSALYRGTVWIDTQAFTRLKLHAVQTNLSGPVVANDETQTFEPAGEIDGHPVWLVTQLLNRQTFLIAGRNVLIEREIHLTDFRFNAPDFEAARQTARASDRIMYRDTDRGVRYFVKRGDTRVVSEQMTSSARAFALGADVDPSFDYPLPIGGLDILDFNFLHRDMQLALLYGGVIALGNIQHPNLWGGKFDASVDFFGLGLKESDDVFDQGGRLTGERVRHIPVSAGVNLGYQATPSQKISGHYQINYDAYSRDTATSSDFVIPSSTSTEGEGATYEYRRRGYSVIADATAYQRAAWRPWGTVAAFDPNTRTYTKYDVGTSKDFVFATFHTIHLNGTYFGGQRLDRFSMYEFGLFDATRMHGVPSAVRFGDLAMLRASYSFNLFDQYRLDLFADHAVGRGVAGDRAWQQVTGTGVRVNFRAPGNTILQLDLGRSFLPLSYRGAGSTVLQVLLLKPL